MTNIPVACTISLPTVVLEVFQNSFEDTPFTFLGVEVEVDQQLTSLPVKLSETFPTTGRVFEKAPMNICFCQSLGHTALGQDARLVTKAA